MRRRAGFTLVEMMVAVLVGTVGVVLAAKVAQVIVRQSTKGRQSTDMHSRGRLVSRQLRADIRTAGVGSTGAVGVDRAIPAWAQMFVTSSSGFEAIPAVAGADNIGAIPIGGANTLAGSDAIQLVVPDPGSAVRTEGFAESGNTFIDLPVLTTLGCPGPIIYVSDHTSPTGAGRTQVMFIRNVVGNRVNTWDQLKFAVAPNSDLMCARVSTYWVDDQGWLHRSDLSGPNPGPLLNLGGWVYADPAAAGQLAPGMLDLQVAYRVSAEVYGGAPPAVPAAFWAYDTTGMANGFMGTEFNWFEVRMVRFNLLSRALRRVDGNATTFPLNGRENGAVHNLPISIGPEWIASSEAVTNLRYFDLTTARGVEADPY
ncbi:MAG: prepilin-type N-terminal cleavage/methylation domain-containing protein [Myxococcales bacterium]|nr:prepilin-type N-terminal cleavage/methylation domain-containing protein [Myxococcales bacterium]